MPAPSAAPTVVTTATGGNPTTIHATASMELTAVLPASGRLVTTTVTAGGHNTVATHDFVYTSYAPVPVTGYITKVDTLGDGRSTTFILPVTYLELPKSLIDDSTTPEITPPPASPGPETHNMTWVAGPVIGGVAAIAALGLLGFWLRRRRNKRTLGGMAEGPTPEEIDGREKQEVPGSQFGVDLWGNDSGHPIQELEAGRMYRNESADVHGLHEIGGTQAPGPIFAGDTAQVPRTQDAPFMVYEEACDTCVKERKDNLPSTNGQNGFHPLIAPYVDYCSSANSTVPQPSTITVPGATLTTALAVYADPVSSRLVTTNVMIPFELSGHSTVVTEQTTYMSYAPVPTTAVLTQPATLGDGRSTTWTFIFTYSTVPQSLFGVKPTTSSDGAVNRSSLLPTQPPFSSAPTPAPPSPPITQSLTWVAGPVVGGAALVVFLALVGYRWTRRRRLRALLSSESIIPNEIPRGRNENIGKGELSGSQSSVGRQEIWGNPIRELEAGRPYHSDEGAEVHEVDTAERGF
ncbi:hypothetical protein PG997_009073 [Apiospora hydei]|uniref:Uncharacterized protein n=1 Tax=Apiospora hydei TaxID=1337664 RepID=A0ABR1VT38_9PEZI